MLTDFGLCKDNLKFDETTTTLCGSLDYLSPVEYYFILNCYFFQKQIYFI